MLKNGLKNYGCVLRTLGFKAICYTQQYTVGVDGCCILGIVVVVEGHLIIRMLDIQRGELGGPG